MSQVPSSNMALIVCMTTAGNPCLDEGDLLSDQAEAGACSKSYRLLHSTRHLPPRLGPNTLQAGVCVCVEGNSNQFTDRNSHLEQDSQAVRVQGLVVKMEKEIIYSKQGRSYYRPYHISYFFQVRQAVAEDNCCFGTIDTWILFKLTKGGSREEVLQHDWALIPRFLIFNLLEMGFVKYSFV